MGIIQGSDGLFRPDDPITRGEMAVIIDRIMQFTTAADNTFSDLDEDFYTDAILKCNEAGIINGDGTLVRPTANITREEAVVMLGRAFGLTESGMSSGFSDSADISSWAVGFVNVMTARGYVNGNNGAFNPGDDITRSQVVTILDNAIGGFYTEAGEYTGDVSGIVIVNTDDVVLNDMTVTGDLIIAEGVASGEAILNNVTVTGNTIVRGGGANSIYITGDSAISNLIIEKTDDGEIRVVTEDGSVVDYVYVDDGSDDVILTGTFGSVAISAGITVRAVGAQVELVYIEHDDGQFIIDEESVIDTLVVDAAVTVTNNGTINTAELNVEGAAVEGNEPGETLYAEGVAGVKDTDEDEDDDDSTGTGNSGDAVQVDSITLDATVLMLLNDGTTATLTATVLPTNTTFSTVTWTSSDPNVASVSADGVVTPGGTGTTIITAACGNKTTTATVYVGDTIVTEGTNIQTAINDASDNDVILVQAGTYQEQLVIDKPLTLLGPNAEIPGTQARQPEALITFPAGLADTNIDLIDVWVDGAYVDNVTIAGFYLDDGGYADTANACGIFAHGNNLAVKNNITNGFNYMHIWVSSYRYVGGSWNNTYYVDNTLVEGNYCVNAPGSYMAIYMQGASGTVRNNTGENTSCSLQVQPYGNPTGGLVENNTFDGFGAGLYYNYATRGAGTWVIQNNTISAAVTSESFSARDWSGIKVQTFGTQGSGSYPSVTFINNTIDGTGVSSTDTRYTDIYGIYMKPGIDDNATATFTGNTFTNVECGAYRADGLLDLDGVLANNTFPSGMMVIGDKITTPAAGTVYNTTTGADYTTIQAAIDDATAGDCIYVAEGTYTENVTVNKNSLTVEGAGPAATSVVATDGNSTPLTFSSNNSTVNGLTLTHEYTDTELTDWNFNNNGVTFNQSTSGNTLTECTVSLSRNGVYLNNCQGNNLVNNTIDNNRTGINFCNNVDSTYISGNTISDNWTLGIVYYEHSTTGTDFDTITVTGNTFSNNWYSEILIKNADDSTGTLNVSGNTFSDAPVTYTESADASLNEPGFAAQKPSVTGIGGDAAKPAEDLPTLRIYDSDGVTLQYDGKTMFVDASGTNAAAFDYHSTTLLPQHPMAIRSTFPTVRILLDQITLNRYHHNYLTRARLAYVLKPAGGTGAYSDIWRRYLRMAVIVQCSPLTISNLTLDGTG